MDFAAGSFPLIIGLIHAARYPITDGTDGDHTQNGAIDPVSRPLAGTAHIRFFNPFAPVIASTNR